MKHRTIFAACALAACASLLLAGARSASGAGRQGGAAAAQEPPKVSISADENKAYKKVEEAATPDARLKAAAEFLKKYPKTQIKQDVAALVAESIAGVPDQAQRIPLYESLVKTFDDPEITNTVSPVLVDAYVNAQRLDDAYRVGDAWLGRNPNEVGGRTRLALIAVSEAQKQNPKFVTAGQKYAREAIALMEVNKRPISIDDASWGQFKAQWLPQLYQALGLVAHASGNAAEAKTNLDKAVALGINDPISYVLMADMAEKEYEALATKYKAMPAGAEQDAALKRALEQMDRTIELFAQAVALTEGKPEHETLRAQLMQPLTSYYKYRKGSDAGLQELIAKYKKSPSQ